MFMPALKTGYTTAVPSLISKLLLFSFLAEINIDFDIPFPTLL
jgi:hypothetical protein